MTQSTGNIMWHDFETTSQPLRPVHGILQAGGFQDGSPLCQGPERAQFMFFLLVSDPHDRIKHAVGQV